MFDRLRLKLSNLLYEYIPFSCIVYAKANYGYPWRDLWKMWREAKPENEMIFGFIEDSKEIDFFSKCADRMYEECESYRCVNGCCVVWWHPKRGNIGGSGPAGCSCGDLYDPRGEKVENE